MLQQGIAKYKYSPLNPAEQHLRLLVLEAGQPDSPIICRLEIASLGDIDHIPPYEALSYMWGSREPKCTVTLDGCDIDVQPNLYQALLQLRHLPRQGDESPKTQEAAGDARVLWIDAICIDQDDVRERNHQVAQMGMIYSKAVRVLVWLGLGTSATSTVLSAIRQIPNLHTSGTALQTVWDRSIDYNVVTQWLMDDQQQSPDRHSALTQFLNLEYWYRRWIVQEIVLAAEVWILWGAAKIAWKDTITLAAVLDGQRILSRYILPADDSILIRLNRQRARHHSLGDCSLLALMQDFPSSLCEIPRDNVYALLGMTHDYKGQFSVDYQKSTLEVAVDVVRFLLDHVKQDNTSPGRSHVYDMELFDDVLPIAYLVTRSLKVQHHGISLAVSLQNESETISRAALGQWIDRVDCLNLGAVTHLATRDTPREGVNSKEEFISLFSETDQDFLRLQFDFNDQWWADQSETTILLGSGRVQFSHGLGYENIVTCGSLIYFEDQGVIDETLFWRSMPGADRSFDSPYRYDQPNQRSAGLMFWGNNGLVGICPETTQSGDLIVTSATRLSNQEQQALVVRPQDGYYVLLGSARIKVLPTAKKAPTIHSSNKTQYEETGKDETTVLRIKFNMEALLILGSNWPARGSEIRISG